jgi:hypothetical protein
MKLISGGLGERSKPLVCKTSDGVSAPPVSSNLTPSTNFAARAEVCASAPAFNHTAEAEWLATELYASRCVSQKGAQQWTNNRKENNADS